MIARKVNPAEISGCSVNERTVVGRIESLRDLGLHAMCFSREQRHELRSRLCILMTNQKVDEGSWLIVGRRCVDESLRIITADVESCDHTAPVVSVLGTVAIVHQRTCSESN